MSATPSATSGTAAKSIRQIAACEIEVNIFITHQDKQGDLYMRTWANEGGWSEVWKVNTTITPVMNTTLASVSWQWDDYYVCRVLYLLHRDQPIGSIAKMMCRNLEPFTFHRTVISSSSKPNVRSTDHPATVSNTLKSQMLT